ncbi:MAG TPA: aminoacyl-tRNA hydrolase [Legionellaceae bacterium]|nr:aminoacyl-tRNA hydrolase [Legionellaceae bacterium]
MAIKLIVGLRNPGDAYAPTRHNAGAWFVETLAAAHFLSFKSDKKLGGEWVKCDLDEQHCVLFLPLAFMNQCGGAIRAIAQFYDILPHEILVAHDELDIPAGEIRLKTGGGHGGHNGLRDIIQHFNSADFHRLRIGIGHPGHKDLVSDYVLAKPSRSDKENIVLAINKAMTHVPNIVSGKLALAMQQLHTGG